MLTGLLMLWMAAGEARGQALNDKPYNDTQSSGGLVGPGTYSNQQNDYVRGVDIFEDGTMWIAEGIGALTDVLSGCTSTRVSVFDNAWGTTNEYIVDLGPIGSTVTALDRLWPNDLACDHPSQINGCFTPTTHEHAFACGGFRAVTADSVGDGESEEGPPVTPSVALSSGWIAEMQYDLTQGTPLFNVQRAHPVPSAFIPIWKTFIADGSPSVPVANAYCEVKTVDTLFAVFCTTLAQQQNIFGFNDRARLVSGGVFKGSMHVHSGLTFPPIDPLHTDVIWESDGASEDGFFFVHRYDDINVVGAAGITPSPVGFQISSSGDDAVLSVSCNQSTGEILVAGYYGASDVNFDPDFDPNNPQPCLTTYMPYEGGRDWFVASYTLVAGGSPGSPSGLQLNWVSRGGTEFDDAAEGVIADPSGDVFFTGWDTANGTTRSLMTGGILNPGGGVGTCRLPTWMSYSTPTSGPAEGMDIAVDGIGRPIVTGDFSGTLAPSASSSVSLSSAGGTDAMVLRYNPETGEPMEGFRTGSTQNDYGTDVAVCQFNSARAVYGSDFRGTVDFNPESGTSDNRTADDTDGFASMFDHMPTGEPIRHVSVLLPNSAFGLYTGGVPNSPIATQASWAAAMQPIDDVFNDTDPFPLSTSYTPIPTDGTVSFQFVRNSPQGFNERWSPEYDGHRLAVQEIPITTIDSALTARLVGKRVKGLPHNYFVLGATHNATFRLTRAFFDGGSDNWPFDYPSHADYRGTLFLDTTFSELSVEPLIDLIEDTVSAPANPIIDQSNGVALDDQSPQGWDRQDVFENVEDSKVVVSAAGEKSIGISAEAIGNSTGQPSPWVGTEFASVIHRVLSRLTVCPGDYNRDGTVTAGGAGSDEALFADDFLFGVLYANWNFTVNASRVETFDDGDEAKFGASDMAACPNN